MQFNFGFESNGIKYGWFKKKLYRLPYINNNRSYAFKKLSVINNGGCLSYAINCKNKTIKSLEVLTKKVDWKIEIIKNKDVPF